MCLVFQVPPVLATGELFIFTLTIAIGFCIFLQDFIKDVELSLLQLNKELQETENLQQHIEQRLFVLIQFHSEAKQLSVQFAFFFLFNL